MICARCDKPMKDEDAEPVDYDSPSGPGTTLHVHRQGCKRTPQQTTPSTAWR